MLKGKAAIVTGAGRGIGRAIAIKLAELGANVVINYRNSSKEAEELVKVLEEKGVKAIAVKADISIFSEAQDLVKKALEEFGQIDILVNNAGITKDNLILRMKEEDFDQVINTNLKGTFNCIKHVAPVMLKRKKGRIVNVASVVGIVGNAGQSNYAAAKAGVIGITKSIAKELASRGITVNAVAPGYIETDMTSTLNDKVKDAMLGNIPLRRAGKAEDVANLIAFLVSDEASYITGQVIAVDGGMVM
ncbi:MAG TPA: 3-oxoacyl-[acyl-carrier-protein] reductase [Clostridiaceae bacterium]